MKPGFSARAERAQSGQALVLGMLLAALASLALLRYFAAGQVAGAKARQLHALDAAAYSGALVQARAMNMLAYLNRAQIAHQIAMAHLVTLGSWALYANAQGRQAGRGNPPAYLIAMLFGAAHGAAYQSARTAAGPAAALADRNGELAAAYAAHDDVVQRIFGAVQHEVVAGLPGARLAAMQQVLARNYPEWSDKSRAPAPGGVSDVSGVPNTSGALGASSASGGVRQHESGGLFDISVRDDTWPGFLHTYAGHRQLHGFVQDVARLYGFLGPRDHTLQSPWPVDERCPWLRHELRRRGATEIDARGRWQSIDTESFHALRSNRWIGCYYREYPMGWGWVPSAPGQTPGAAYAEDAPEDFSAQDFWRWVSEATNWDIHAGDANPLANSRAVAGLQRWRGGGLPAYFDVAQPGGTEVFGFTVEFRHPGPEGVLLTSHSAAQTFFARPQPRADGLEEAPNLFHPYWQARLAWPDAGAAGQVRP
jgi:hypothetical protein